MLKLFVGLNSLYAGLHRHRLINFSFQRNLEDIDVTDFVDPNPPYVSLEIPEQEYWG